MVFPTWRCGGRSGEMCYGRTGGYPTARNKQGATKSAISGGFGVWESPIQGNCRGRLRGDDVRDDLRTDGGGFRVVAVMYGRRAAGLRLGAEPGPGGGAAAQRVPATLLFDTETDV